MSRVTATHAVAWVLRLIAWTIAGWLLGWPGVLLLCTAGALTYVAAVFIEPRRTTPVAAMALALTVALLVALLGATLLWPDRARLLLPIGVGVFVCHAVAYLVDVHRGKASTSRLTPALAYMVQLPVFPVGPLSRFHDFAAQWDHGDVSIGGFSYGVRRVVTGAIKIYLFAVPLGATAEQIFALRVTRLSIDTAWLGAVCAALEAYYYVSGFSDVGIGVGKMIGFRYQENFRRPFTADSVREYWRRWNVTLITWLRDYAALPIAGHERATMRGYLLTVAGFLVVGAWQRPGWHVLPWAVYFGSWLALETAFLGAHIERLPRVLRHAYVLLVILAGWLLLHVSGPGHLLGYLEAMVGSAIRPFGEARTYLTAWFTTALACAVFLAGPMIGNVSRWRVSVDAAVASLIMMFAATAVLLWHVLAPIRRLFTSDPVQKHGR